MNNTIKHLLMKTLGSFSGSHIKSTLRTMKSNENITFKP